MTPDQFEARQFRSSDITPFAANMAFEIYKLKPEVRRLHKKNVQKRSTTSEGLIRLLVNEVPMAIPGCGADVEDPSTYFCEWSTFKQVLEQAGAGCDFAACCTTLGGNSTQPATPTPSPTSSPSGSAPVCLPVDPITA